MKSLAPIALLSLVLAAPAFAGGISMDMPNLSFPAPKPVLSTAGCDAATPPADCAAGR